LPRSMLGSSCFFVGFSTPAHNKAPGADVGIPLLYVG